MTELTLMPWPAEITVNKDQKFRITPDFFIGLKANSIPDVQKAATRFLRRLDGRTGLFFKQGFLSEKDVNPEADFQISYLRKDRIFLGMEEMYQLTVGADKIFLHGPSHIGVLRGLETLLQLLNCDEEGYFFPVVRIKDVPRFRWRGLLIDVARHWLPVEKIKQNIDGMAAVKMNVLHLHLCDDQGFRVECKKLPLLHEKGSDGQYYSHEQIREIIAYAQERGIRVMPEIDVPGHATAILTAYPELGSAPGPYEIERKAGIMNPTLNPASESTYKFLETLFTEIASLFPDQFFHIGGDENEGKHWDANPDIQTFMREHEIEDNSALQTYFNQRLVEILNKLGKNLIGWDEILQPDLPRNTIIHSWRGKESLVQAAKDEYSCILSHGYYMDLGYPASTHYLNDPHDVEEELTEKEESQILGGEATMWSELVSPRTIDSRIWPRTAAIAERLWSPTSIKKVDDMYRRLKVIDYQLEELGLEHNTAREAIMRNLCRGEDITPLKTLIDVIEPMKGYSRNQDGELYTMYSPLTLVADAARPDAKVAREFRKRVKDYLENPDFEKKETLVKQLIIWLENHNHLVKIIQKSPILKEIKGLSVSLSKVAGIGLLSLRGELGTDMNTKNVLKTAREQGGRCELQIVDAIEDLMNR